MALVSYPPNLKLPLLSGYSLSQQSNLMRTEMESGTARVRKRFNSVPTMMQASWMLSDDAAIYFTGFITNAIDAGVNWFLMPIRTPEGLIEHEVRFITSPLESESFDGSSWIYSASIEIKKRQLPTEEATVAQATQPNTFNDFVDGIDDAMNDYQPE